MRGQRDKRFGPMISIRTLACAVFAAGVIAFAQSQEGKETAAWESFEAKWDTIRAEMTSPAENLSIPLEYHTNGRIKARLRAKRAQIFDNGNTIYAEGVRVELLTDEGAPDGELTAMGCLFDRKMKAGYCKGPVSVRRSGDQINGVDLFFSSAEEKIKILHDCEIRTRRFKGSFSRF